MCKIKKIMFGEDELKRIVSDVADKINSDIKREEIDKLTLLCVLKGAAVFTSDLARKLDVPDLRIEYIRASSYGMGGVSSGDVDIRGLTSEIENSDVLVVEDIIDTGRTLSRMREYLKEKNPKSLRFCGLFDKPDRRAADFEADYIGVRIPDEFIVGYGLDYAEKFRHLPYVAVIEPSDDD